MGLHHAVFPEVVRIQQQEQLAKDAAGDLHGGELLTGMALELQKEFAASLKDQALDEDADFSDVSESDIAHEAEMANLEKPVNIVKRKKKVTKTQKAEIVQARISKKAKGGKSGNVA